MSIIGPGVTTEISRSLSGIDVHIVRDPAGLAQSAFKRKSKFERIKSRGLCGRSAALASEMVSTGKITRTRRRRGKAMVVGVSIETGSTPSQEWCKRTQLSGTLLHGKPIRGISILLSALGAALAANVVHPMRLCRGRKLLFVSC
jgi:hypothetical protein